MGFKNFYPFSERYQNHFNTRFLTHEKDDSKRPWLLVDFSNLFSVSLQDGGHNILGRSFCKEFLFALFTSNHRIMIFLDGECDSLRSVTKLKRMVEDVARIKSKDSEAITADTLCPEMVC
jgi:hypothetical protein